MAIDGWSNISNVPVMEIAIAAVGKLYLVDTKDITRWQHTADYSTEITKQATENTEARYRAHVGSVTTDGAANKVAT